MAGHDSDRAWDEYEWERFLQQQDQKTEKYMELLEKYIDDPQRDEIVAREMGWCHQAEEAARTGIRTAIRCSRMAEPRTKILRTS